MSRDPALHQAYLNTRYRIFVPQQAAPLDLRAGQHSAQLDLQLDHAGVTHAAFITACNPFSKALSTAANQARMRTFETELERANWRWWPASGVPDDKAWTAEPSVLVLGMDRPSACQWGQRYEQNALLYVQRGTAPRLIWLVD